MKQQLIHYISFGFCLTIFYTSFAQEKKKLDPVEIEFLFDYYKQDGNNSPVTGGEGTEKLKNTAPLLSVKIPVSPIANLSIKGGIDSYTSASSGNIDLYATSSGASSNNTTTNKVSASEKDTRKHFNIGYSENFTKSEFNFNAGYSTEYDVNSVNVGIGFSQYLNNQNQKISIAGNTFIDRWLLIYPGEIREANATNTSGSLSKDDFNTDVRYTYNANIGFQSVINQRTNFALITDITKQNGILNTPFHRVYFDDNETDIEDKEVRVESLPRNRLKVAVGLRLNHFLTSSIITRFYYRYYFDDFGIKSHTVSLEIPIKTGKIVTFYPFIRFYNQTQSDYFAAFGEHSLTATYYTSDYDQSSFSSFHRGIGLKIAPPNGIISFSKLVAMKNLQVRYSNYERTNDFKANNITFSTKFILN